MTLTVRLDPQLSEQLERHCRKRRLSKSQVVTRILREHLAAEAGTARSPYTLAKQFGLIGSFASGKGDLAENRKHYLKRKLRAKYSR
jgi:hypothetical protein